MKRRTARERYFADEWPSRRPGPRWCFTDRAALRRWCRPRSHRPRCLVPSHAAPPAPPRRHCTGSIDGAAAFCNDDDAAIGTALAGAANAAALMAKTAAALAWQIHDLISIPDLQHRSRCNAVGQPAGLALRSVLARRSG